MTKHSNSASEAPPSGYYRRPFTKADARAIIALTAANAAVDPQQAVATEASLGQIFALLGRRLQHDTAAIFTTDDALAGLGLVFFVPPDDERVASIDVTIHVAHTGRGLDDYLLEWLEQRARQEFAGLGDALPQLMRISCPGYQVERIELYRRHGFGAARYAYRVGRSLSASALSAISGRERPLPAGIRLSPWLPEREADVMHAFNEAFAGQWGVPKLNTQMWCDFFVGVPQFRAEYSFLALAENEIAGFCVNWVREDRNPQAGSAVGWIEAVGVRPSWRSRGIASALLVRSMAAFMATGLTSVELDVDTQNPTGALRLYEKLGFAPVRESIRFEKRLSSPG